MGHSVSRLMVAVVPLVLAACADNLPTSPTAQTRLSNGWPASDIAPLSLWADHVEGTTANGALYALFKPVNWNGDVIYYAHGIIDPAVAVALPTGDDAGDPRCARPTGIRDRVLQLVGDRLQLQGRHDADAPASRTGERSVRKAET